MKDLTTIAASLSIFLGVMAFIVSIVTEVLKKWEWFDKKMPTALTVIILSIILCPLSLLGLASYYGMVIEWYMVFAAFIAAFIVALIAMDGWERLTDLKDRFIRR